MRSYIENFCSEFDYPAEATQVMLSAYDKIYENRETAKIWDEILNNYDEKREISMTDLKPKCEAVTEATGVHDYTVKLLVHICLSRTLRAYYKEKGLDDGLWFSAMSDLKWKLIESHLVYDVWGTFVADCNWFSRWYDITRFALGRLQFEIASSNCDYDKNDIKLPKGTKIINVHIPRTGTPLNHDEVLDAYRRAKVVFKDEFKDGEPMIFYCSSWLLFPEHTTILNEKSNILKFMSDYDIFASGYYPDENKSSLWRVFDCPMTVAIDDLPENSFLQRAYKKHLQAGGKRGYGIGLFFADSIPPADEA